MKFPIIPKTLGDLSHTLNLVISYKHIIQLKLWDVTLTEDQKCM